MMQSNKKKAVISHFERIARPDEYFAGGWITIKAKRNEHKIVSDLLDGAGDFYKKMALDVGCGIGGYSDILVEKGFTVVGFDIAENMIKVCRSKYAQSVRLMLADIEYMPFQPNSFDLVLCIDSLQYIKDKARRSALEDMTKLLKPGALIIVDVKNKACPAYQSKRFRRDPFGELYGIASATSVLKNSGCKIEAIKGTLGPSFISPIVVVKARKED